MNNSNNNSNRNTYKKGNTTIKYGGYINTLNNVKPKTRFNRIKSWTKKQGKEITRKLKPLTNAVKKNFVSIPQFFERPKIKEEVDHMAPYELVVTELFLKNIEQLSKFGAMDKFKIFFDYIEYVPDTKPYLIPGLRIELKNAMKDSDVIDKSIINILAQLQLIREKRKEELNSQTNNVDNIELAFLESSKKMLVILKNKYPSTNEIDEYISANTDAIINTLHETQPYLTAAEHAAKKAAAAAEAENAAEIRAEIKEFNEAVTEVTAKSSANIQVPQTKQKEILITTSWIDTKIASIKNIKLSQLKNIKLAAILVKNPFRLYELMLESSALYYSVIFDSFDSVDNPDNGYNSNLVLKYEIIIKIINKATNIQNLNNLKRNTHIDEEDRNINYDRIINQLFFEYKSHPGYAYSILTEILQHAAETEAEETARAADAVKKAANAAAARARAAVGAAGYDQNGMEEAKYSETESPLYQLQSRDPRSRSRSSSRDPRSRSRSSSRDPRSRSRSSWEPRSRSRSRPPLLLQPQPHPRSHLGGAIGINNGPKILDTLIKGTQKIKDLMEKNHPTLKQDFKTIESKLSLDNYLYLISNHEVVVLKNTVLRDKLDEPIQHKFDYLLTTLKDLEKLLSDSSELYKLTAPFRSQILAFASEVPLVVGLSIGAVGAVKALGVKATNLMPKLAKSIADTSDSTYKSVTKRGLQFSDFMDTKTKKIIKFLKVLPALKWVSDYTTTAIENKALKDIDEITKVKSDLERKLYSSKFTHENSKMTEDRINDELDVAISRYNEVNLALSRLKRTGEMTKLAKENKENKDFITDSKENLRAKLKKEELNFEEEEKKKKDIQEKLDKLKKEKKRVTKIFGKGDKPLTTGKKKQNKFITLCIMFDLFINLVNSSTNLGVTHEKLGLSVLNLKDTNQYRLLLEMIAELAVCIDQQGITDLYKKRNAINPPEFDYSKKETDAEATRKKREAEKAAETAETARKKKIKDDRDELIEQRAFNEVYSKEKKLEAKTAKAKAQSKAEAAAKELAAPGAKEGGGFSSMKMVSFTQHLEKQSHIDAIKQLARFPFKPTNLYTENMKLIQKKLNTQYKTKNGINETKKFNKVAQLFAITQASKIALYEKYNKIINYGIKRRPNKFIMLCMMFDLLKDLIQSSFNVDFSPSSKGSIRLLCEILAEGTVCMSKEKESLIYRDRDLYS
jgi:hypothetical protein